MEPRSSTRGTTECVEWLALLEFTNSWSFLEFGVSSSPRKTLQSDPTSCTFIQPNWQWTGSLGRETKYVEHIRQCKIHDWQTPIDYLQFAAFRRFLLSYPVFLHHPIGFSFMRGLALIEFKSSSPTIDGGVWEYSSGLPFGSPLPNICRVALTRANEVPKTICVRLLLLTFRETD